MGRALAAIPGRRGRVLVILAAGAVLLGALRIVVGSVEPLGGGVVGRCAV